MSIDYAKIMNQPSPLSQGIISGERVLGAEAFREQVLRAAAGFSALGVERGECVALLLRNDLAFLVASLAAARLISTICSAVCGRVTGSSPPPPQQ